jgi:hypothetical protein
VPSSWFTPNNRGTSATRPAAIDVRNCGTHTHACWGLTLECGPRVTHNLNAVYHRAPALQEADRSKARTVAVHTLAIPAPVMLLLAKLSIWSVVSARKHAIICTPFEVGQPALFASCKCKCVCVQPVRKYSCRSPRLK